MNLRSYADSQGWKSDWTSDGTDRTPNLYLLFLTEHGVRKFDDTQTRKFRSSSTYLNDDRYDKTFEPPKFIWSPL